MKKYLYILFSIALLGFAQSCVGDFDAINKDPNKLYEDVELQKVFPGTFYKTLNVMANMNFKYYAAQARYTLSNKEQKDKDNTGDDFYNFYKRVLADLTSLELKYAGTPGNEQAMIATWKAYVYSVLTATWGAIPMDEACTNTHNNQYSYNTEAEANMEVLRLLDKAVSGFDPNGYTMSKDPFFRSTTGRSDIHKWRKFANSLRLDVAMRMMNMQKSPLAIKMAREQIEIALDATNINYLISSVAEIAKGNWGTDPNSDVSYYYNSFLKEMDSGIRQVDSNYPSMNQYFFTYMKSYNDPRLHKWVVPSVNDASGDFRGIVEDNLYYAAEAKMVRVQYRVPYFPRGEFKNPPSGWVIGKDEFGQDLKNLFNVSNAKEAQTYAYVNRDFVKQDAVIKFITWADVEFMLAEIALRGSEWGLSVTLPQTARGYYEAGIMASMSEYGVSPSEIGEYMAVSGIEWNTNGEGCWDYRSFYKADIYGKGGYKNNLEQVWKQRYIASFFNGFAGWTLNRRTRVMNYPPVFYNGSVSNFGTYGNNLFDTTPERQIYPHEEANWNNTYYMEACQSLQSTSMTPRAGGNDNLFTPLGICGEYDAAELQGKWGSGGVVMYSNEQVNHWYGETVEEFIINVKKDFPLSEGFQGLEKYIDFKILPDRT